MASGYSAQKLRIIKSAEARGKGWGRRALEKLDREYGAEESLRDGKRVGVVLGSGLVICKKTTFKTEARARAALGQIDMVVLDDTHHRPVRAYNCGHCGLWHLTSRPAL